jgi:hypothetical protein
VLTLAVFVFDGACLTPLVCQFERFFWVLGQCRAVFVHHALRGLRRPVILDALIGRRIL